MHVAFMGPIFQRIWVSSDQRDNQITTCWRKQKNAKEMETWCNKRWRLVHKDCRIRISSWRHRSRVVIRSRFTYVTRPVGKNWKLAAIVAAVVVAVTVVVDAVGGQIVFVRARTFLWKNLKLVLQNHSECWYTRSIRTYVYVYDQWALNYVQKLRLSKNAI